MLDLTKTYCLKSNRNKPFTINRQVDEKMLTPKLVERGVEVDDYMCQWIEKSKPQVDYYNEHQLEVHDGGIITKMFKG